MCYRHNYSSNNVSNFLFLGRIGDPPSQLKRVCVGPSTSLQLQGRVNISWDSLPCHLQNGADISHYIIQYTRLPNGSSTNLSSSDRRLACHQEPGGPYSCVAATQVASTTVLEDSINSRPLIFTTTTSTVAKTTAFQHCICKEGRLIINLKYTLKFSYCVHTLAYLNIFDMFITA